jgi:hypothetical protein
VDADLTLSEAVQVLDPPMAETQLRAIVRALRWKPSGSRRTGRSGHPRATYPAADIMGLHLALVPFLRG